MNFPFANQTIKFGFSMLISHHEILSAVDKWTGSELLFEWDEINYSA